MEPVTHFLTGACIGRAGLNRKTAYATLAAVLASEAADMDMFWSLGGPVEGLKHHRGITHTFVAAPVVAGVIVGLVALIHLWWDRRRRRKLAALQLEPGAPIPHRLQPRAISWAWLYASALISALSHLLLDWTNNYGLRPFFPFNPRWYAGSFVFIAEPVLWALLLTALLVPALLGLIAGEIGARRKPFRGRGWAILALAGVVVLWGWRWSEHAQALALIENTQVASAPVKRVAAEPYPINPFRWHAILETADFYQTAEVNTRTGEVDSDPQRDVLYKPPATAAVEAAKQTPLGQVYLDWGTWAVVRDVGQEPVPGMAPPQLPPSRASNWTTVEFTDLRFAYSYLGTGRATGRSPLGGWVYIVDGHEDAGEFMGGREQR
ncbi:MAG TPA: metal-dependent hydrolase [Terracidiphilus sp.]|nr:metal-dependent hydrolase [Terracidiphilus sp.]